MAENNYFRYIPNFEYVSRGPDKIGTSDFTTVKNFFVRGLIREDVYNNVTIFDRYIIEGDERPDNVAFKLYNDSNLDWVVLLSNNIIDVYSEWPLSKENFEAYILEKYGSFEKLYEPRYYETLEIKNVAGDILLPAGLVISSQYIDFDQTIIEEQEIFNEETEEFETVEVEVPNPNYLGLKPSYLQYFDYSVGVDKLYTGITKEVTNYDYELQLNEEKRQIFVLKRDYINIILDKMEENLEYKKGSEQFVYRTLKRGSTLDFDV